MPSLSESERLALLNLARQAVTEAVSRGQILAAIPSSGIFSHRSGVFVSLHIGKRLRGCIGVVEPEEPLAHSVVRCAASAALQDARFPAVRPDELSDLQIEISLLSPALPIRPERSKLAVTACLFREAASAGCCSLRWPSSTISAPSCSLPNPAARPNCRPMPGAKQTQISAASPARFFRTGLRGRVHPANRKMR